MSQLETPSHGLATEDLNEPVTHDSQADRSADQDSNPAEIAPCKLLCIDDEVNVLSALRRVFRSDEFEVLTASNGREAIALARKHQPDIVICDMRMPEMSGVEVLQAIDELCPDAGKILLSGYADLQSTIDAINLGHVNRYLGKPWNEDEIRLVVKELLAVGRLRKQRDQLADQLAQKVHELEEFNEQLDQKVIARTQEVVQTNLFLEQSYRELKSQFLSAVRVFSNLIELRAPQMGGHSHRVAELARCLCTELALNDQQTQDVYIAALLHDIGKIGLSDRILFTPVAELTGEERASLMQHPVKGQTTLLALPDMHHAATCIRYHHERYDGLGFPDGLIRDFIPIGARIVAVAEDYDELQQGWIARKKLSETEALDFITQSAGKRYDPLVVEALPAALEKLRIAPREDEKLLEASQLRAGMMVTRDVMSPEGLLLVAKECPVTPALIAYLQEAQEAHGLVQKVYVHRVKTKPWKRPSQ